jgi:hypothetical protein
MNENYSDVNVSSGQGQGLAQVFTPYQPTYDMGQIGMVEAQNRAAKLKAEQDKKDKIAKLAGEIKIEPMTPNFMRGTEPLKKAIIDATISGDYEKISKAKGDLDNYLAIGTTHFKNLQSRMNDLYQNPDGTFENEDIIDELYNDKTEVTPQNMYDLAVDYDTRLSAFKKKAAPFSFEKEINLLQSVVPTIQDEKRTYRDEQMAKDGVWRAASYDAGWNKYAKEQFALAPKVVQDQYKGDFATWAADTYYKDLIVDNQAPASKGGNTYYNYPNNPEKVTEGVVTKQVRPIGAGGRNVDVRAFLYPKPVDLGARTKVDRMFKIGIDNETTPVDGNTPAVSYNETIEAPVSTVDVEWTGRDGIKRSVKKGQIVDPEDARKYAEIYTGKQIPTELTLLSFGFDNANNKYYEPAERIAPSSVASFYGADGGTAKSQYTKEGIEKTAGGTKTTTKAAAQGGNRR